MGIQINGQTDTITAIDGELNVSGADLGSASAGSLNVTGIVTASGFSGNVTGNVLGNISAAGVSTFSNGPVFIGTGTSTGTASQPLQVTGGAYVSGNLGIGFTNPGAKLHLIGNQYLQGGNYFTDTTSGYFWAGNGSFAGGIYGSNSGNVTTIISPQTINFLTSNTQRVTIDSSGRVAKPSQPYFYARPTTSGDGQTANPYTFANVLHNVGNHFVTSGTGAYQRFVAPIDGVYCFQTSPGYKQTSVDWNVYFRINGTAYAEVGRFIGSPSSHSICTGSITLKLSANDYVDVSNQGITYHINNTLNFFCGYLLG